MLWFTADQHFNHNNIIKYCNRPFTNVEEMNNTLIRNWNNCVLVSDTIIVLGDFCLGSVEDCQDYLDLLNGKKILVVGNHDRNAKKAKWDEIYPKYYKILYKDIFIYMCHKNQQIVKCDWCLYAHSHTTTPDFDNYSCNVGVDAWNFSPVSFKTLQEIFNQEI